MTQGVLLLHGFTATPKCMEPLAAPLRKKGFRVASPLLAGHGTTARELGQTTWQDWYQSAMEAYKKLQQETESVSVAGLSMGGLLALMLASEYPVSRIALLATPVFFAGFATGVLLPLVGHTPLQHLYRYHPKFVNGAINDPDARKSFVSYSKMPIRGVMQIVHLQKEVIPRLKTIGSPTLILHAVHDTVSPYQNMEFLRKNLGSKIIETVSLEKSNHVITLDYERDLVKKEVVSFFEEETS